MPHEETEKLRRQVIGVVCIFSLPMSLIRMAVSANAATQQNGNGNNRTFESITASSFLFWVVAKQILAGFSKAVRLGPGRAGRMAYYTAFAVTIVHDFFIALLVPASLLWVAVELLRGTRDIGNATRSDCRHAVVRPRPRAKRNDKT